MILENQVLMIRKNSLKKMSPINLNLKIRKSHLVIRIIQNILIKHQMSLLKTLLKVTLLLRIKKNLKTEKGLKIFHLKNLKKINTKELNLFDNIKPISHFTGSV